MSNRSAFYDVDLALDGKLVPRLVEWRLHPDRSEGIPKITEWANDNRVKKALRLGAPIPDPLDESTVYRWAMGLTVDKPRSHR